MQNKNCVYHVHHNIEQSVTCSAMPYHEYTAYKPSALENFHACNSVALQFSQPFFFCGSQSLLTLICTMHVQSSEKCNSF